ncbi:TraR/DksA C4-type zinc finger protein [Paenibacillus medicaginis]|uniref:TraR/DksA C4-type zinc finger protein n=1 Tax=Paenibacillus medicaginis TaxID=1470560 RepID=A0ABV5BVM1_9BACL
MSPLTEQQLNTLRNELLKRKQDIEHRLHGGDGHRGLSDGQRAQTGELSLIDNHPGDVGTETYERGKDLALVEHDEFMLERIDSALKAMEEGTYGICATSGKPIPYERLLAVPYTKYLAEYNPEQEVSNNRPVEEEFLYPPFGRSSLDEHEYNGFDGEDAWQIVSSWGNSNSPALSENREVHNYDEVEIEDGDDNQGFVESYESFIATDITGDNVTIVRGPMYQKYMKQGEGEPLLEPDVNTEE